MANLKNTTIDGTVFRLPAGDTAARSSSPNGREIRFNTDTGQLEQFRPGLGAWIAPLNTGVIATGGDAVYDVDVEGTTYRVHVFTATGTSTFSVLQGGEVEYLIVAGGGGGGERDGGGGGAGELKTGTTTVSLQSYSVTVGEGGAGAPQGGDAGKGEDSVFGDITCLGGGRGESNNQNQDLDGGSGGGGQGTTSSSYKGDAIGSGFGNDGGAGAGNEGGGGGGAGGPGGFGDSVAGFGGIGVPSEITGIFTYYAGGGSGGGEQSATRDVRGGLGGGGDERNQNNPSAGTPNTGGGGAGSNADGAAGGSGIVVIRYPLRQENPVTAPGRAVGDGLVLDLDFAKPTVYNGSGSVVTDSRLNGLEGDLINGPTYINTRTNRSAFDFNGSNQGINLGITGDEIVNPSTFTYAGWAWHVDADFNDWEIIIGSRLGTDHQIGGESGTKTFAILTNTSGTENFSSNKVIADEQWHFVVSTFDNGDLKGYVDSELIIDASTDNNSVVFVDAIGIGYEPEGNRRYWNGEIASTKIYTKALSESEIQSIYNATRWRFGV